MKCFPCLLSNDSSKRVIESLVSPTKISESKQKMQDQNMIKKKDIITRILMDNQNIYSPKLGDQINSSSKTTIIEITPNIPNIQKTPRRISKEGSDISETSKRYTSSYRKEMVNTLRQIPNRQITDESIFNNYGSYSQLNTKNKIDLTTLTNNTYKNNEKLNKTKNDKKNINISINLIVKNNKYLSYINNNPTYNTLSYNNSPISQKINIHNKLQIINCFNQTPKKYNIRKKKNYSLNTSPASEVNTTKPQSSKKKYLSLNKNLLSEFLGRPKSKIYSYKIKSTKCLNLYQVRYFSPKTKKNNCIIGQSLIHLNSNSLKKINPFLSPEEILVRVHTNISGDFDNMSTRFRNYNSPTRNNLSQSILNNLSNSKNKISKINIKLESSKNSPNFKKVATGKKKIQNENGNTSKNSEKMKTKYIKKLQKEKKFLPLTFIYKDKNRKNGKITVKSKDRIKNINMK